MSADTLLSRLENVRKTGDNKWIACCPAHPDRTPSLSIREEADGRVLLKDHAGCTVEEILAAVDLSWDALFPPRPLPSHSSPPLRRPWIPSDVFEIARREIGIVAITACDMHKDRTVTEAGYQRLFVAVQRLNDIAGAAYGK